MLRAVTGWFCITKLQTDLALFASLLKHSKQIVSKQKIYSAAGFTDIITSCSERLEGSQVEKFQSDE